MLCWVTFTRRPAVAVARHFASLQSQVHWADRDGGICLNSGMATTMVTTVTRTPTTTSTTTQDTARGFKATHLPDMLPRSG